MYNGAIVDVVLNCSSYLRILLNLLLATRLCMENSEWNVSNVDDCQTEPYKSLESRVMENDTTTALIEHAFELSNFTNTVLPILPQDIITTGNILDMIIK